MKAILVPSPVHRNSVRRSLSPSPLPSNGHRGYQTPKPSPLVSLKVESHSIHRIKDDVATHSLLGQAGVPCLCSLCQKFCTFKALRDGETVMPKTMEIDDRVAESKPYSWLLVQLSGQEEKCKVRIPDTVFFRRGKPKTWFSNLWDGSIVRNMNAETVHFSDLSKNLVSTVRLQRKKYEMFLKAKDPQVTITKYRVRRTPMQKQADLEREIRNELCLQRFKDGAVRVLSESDFVALAMKKKSMESWIDTEQLQAIIASAKDGGLLYRVEYRVNIDSDNAQVKFHCSREDVDIKARQVTESILSSMVNSICAFVRRNASLDIVSITAEFIVDDMEQIWLTQAYEILVKPLKVVQRELLPWELSINSFIQQQQTKQLQFDNRYRSKSALGQRPSSTNTVHNRLNRSRGSTVAFETDMM